MRGQLLLLKDMQCQPMFRGFKNMEEDKGDGFLKFPKGEGLSTRQLARLTEISKGII